MASGSFLMRLVSSSVAVANRAGGIIRSIMKTGSLGVVDKVLFISFVLLFFFDNSCSYNIDILKKKCTGVPGVSSRTVHMHIQSELVWKINSVCTHRSWIFGDHHLFFLDMKQVIKYVTTVCFSLKSNFMFLPKNFSRHSETYKAFKRLKPKTFIRNGVVRCVSH